MPDPNPIEESLNKIETGIRQLKLQYDMFFSGVAPRQPFEIRKELEILLNTVGNQPMQRFADRYRYNALASKYQTMVELWNKMIRAKEEGRLRPGIPGFVEPVRRAAAGPAAPVAPAGKSAQAQRQAVGAAQPGKGAGSPEFYKSRFSDPAAEDTSFRVFYDRYLEANRLAGAQSPKEVSYKSFLKQITAKTKAIKAKAGCDAVTYSIVVKDGGVSLKAVPAGQSRGKGGGK
jgi:hypothetical protein